MQRLYAITERFDALRKKAADAGGYAAPGFNHALPYLYDVRVEPERSPDLASAVESAFGAGAESLSLLDRLSLKLGIERYRREFENVFDASLWQKQSCPLCGEQAGLARIGEDGCRRLICHFCWTEWDYMRLSCAYCGEEAAEYALFAANGADVRAYHCEGCRRYVKTLLYDRTIESPAYWDLKTIPVDDWAFGRGYLRPCPALIGVDFSK